MLGVAWYGLILTFPVISKAYRFTESLLDSSCVSALDTISPDQSPQAEASFGLGSTAPFHTPPTAAKDHLDTRSFLLE